VNIASGRCDAFISGCKSPWDIYAGETMLIEQGSSIYKSKLGLSVYSNSTELFSILKKIIKDIEKECK
jgi:fructose-1,6-bisphosphatase/inositol monophosphatase family enzyme